jgi:hypothetical protein
MTFASPCINVPTKAACNTSSYNVMIFQTSNFSFLPIGVEGHFPAETGFMSLFIRRNVFFRPKIFGIAFTSNTAQGLN